MDEIKLKAKDNVDMGLMLLSILFIAFKLSHIIDWSWWWVLSPIWSPLPIIFIFVFTKELWNRRKLEK